MPIETKNNSYENKYRIQVKGILVVVVLFACSGVGRGGGKLTDGNSLLTASEGANGCTDDTWTPTSTANAPSARFYHTAVWTGSEVIVWGGEGHNGVLLNTGGRYNPATDTWAATSTNNVPSGREFHTAVWTGSEMIVWGDSTAAFSTPAGDIIQAPILGQLPAPPTRPLPETSPPPSGPAVK